MARKSFVWRQSCFYCIDVIKNYNRYIFRKTGGPDKMHVNNTIALDQVTLAC